jgi:hypothetical protein
LALHDELRQFAAAAPVSPHRRRGGILIAQLGLATRSKAPARLTDLVLAATRSRFSARRRVEDAGACSQRTQLLAVVIQNPRVGEAAPGLLQIAKELGRRRRALSEEAAHCIPTSTSTFEVLSLRLTVLHLHRALEGATAALAACGFDPLPLRSSDPDAVRQPVARRLAELRAERLRALRAAATTQEHRFRLRHLLREIGRLDRLLGSPECEREDLRRHEQELACRRNSAPESMIGIPGPEDGGFSSIRSSAGRQRISPRSSD